jgi:hypothetical protein
VPLQCRCLHRCGPRGRPLDTRGPASSLGGTAFTASQSERPEVLRRSGAKGLGRHHGETRRQRVLVWKQDAGLAEDQTAKLQEVVIAGFTAPRRTRPFFGALVLAVREHNSRRYIGHVGTGFSHKTLEELHTKLVKLEAAKSPFPVRVKDEAATTWIKPSLVAEVKFAEWTSKGELRQPVYLGLRDDKQAKDVVRERERPRKRAGQAGIWSCRTLPSQRTASAGFICIAPLTCSSTPCARSVAPVPNSSV